jgi:hypothetical protein
MSQIATRAQSDWSDNKNKEAGSKGKDVTNPAHVLVFWAHP